MAFLTSSFSDLPPGFRFFPTDSELMLHLKHKVMNPNYHHELISDYDVYKQAPWNLPWDRSQSKSFHGNERFFLVQRKPLSGKDSGTRPKRTVETGEGWWHANTEDKPILDEQRGGVTSGYVKSLTFFVKDEEKRKQQTGRGNRKQEGTKTDWIMHEYVVNKKNVKEWVLCRIRYNGKQPLVMPSDSSTSTIHPPPQLTSWQFCGGHDARLPPFTGASAQELHHYQEPYALPQASLQFCGGPDPRLPPFTGASSQEVHQEEPYAPPQRSLQYCVGPDPQLPPFKRQRSTGVFAQQVHHQEPYAPSLFNKNIQDTETGEIGRTGFEWSSDGVAEGVVEETLVEDLVGMCGSLQQQPAEKPWEECDREYSEALVGVSPLQLQQQQPEQTFEEYAQQLESILEIDSEALVGVSPLQLQRQQPEQTFEEYAQQLESILEIDSEALVGVSPLRLQQQQPEQTFEEYAQQLESILEIDSEALVVSPLQQQQPILEERDVYYAEEVQATLERKSSVAVAQAQPVQQPPEEKSEAEGDWQGRMEDELLMNFDFSQLPLHEWEWEELCNCK